MRLTIDVDAQPWSLLHTWARDALLGIPEGPVEASVGYLTSPRREPEELALPVALEAAGRTPASLMTLRRGAQTDLLVSERLMTALGDAVLPPHARLACDVEIRLGHGERASGLPVQRFTWLWFRAPWTDVDFAASTFARHDRSGHTELVTFDCHEDYVQVRRRGLRGDFVLVPHVLATPITPTCDLAPEDGGEAWRISEALAARLRSAALPHPRHALSPQTMRARRGHRH